MAAQAHKDLAEDVFFEPSADAAVVIAFVGLEGVLNVEAIQSLHEKTMVVNQDVLPPDVQGDRDIFSD
jgi:hypothetical protein